MNGAIISKVSEKEYKYEEVSWFLLEQVLFKSTYWNSLNVIHLAPKGEVPKGLKCKILEYQ